MAAVTAPLLREPHAFAIAVSASRLSDLASTVNDLEHLFQITTRAHRTALLCFCGALFFSIAASAPIGGICLLLSCTYSYYTFNQLGHIRGWLQGFKAVSQGRIDEGMQILNKTVKPEWKNKDLSSFTMHTITVDQVFKKGAYQNFLKKVALEPAFAQATLLHALHQLQQNPQVPFRQIRQKVSFSLFLSSMQRCGNTPEETEMGIVLRGAHAETALRIAAVNTRLPKKITIGRGMLWNTLHHFQSLRLSDLAFDHKETEINAGSLKTWKATLKTAQARMKRSNTYTECEKRVTERLLSATSLRQFNQWINAMPPNDLQKLKNDFVSLPSRN